MTHSILANLRLSPYIKKSIKRSALALLVSSVIALPAVAAPAISQVQGQLIQGASITIAGNGFSTVDPGLSVKHGIKPLSYRMFGRSPQLQASTAWNQPLWMSRGSSWATPMRPAAMSAPDASIVDYVYVGLGKAYNSYLSPFHGANNNKLYVSWQYLPSESPAHSGGSNKFIRIWDNHSGDDTRISWTQMHMTYTGSNRASWESWSGTVGQWNHMELWVDGEKGEIIASVNGVVAHKIDNFKKIDQGLGLNIGLLGFDPNKAENYKDMLTVIDNLYASTTRARVIISDKPNWKDARRYGEVQILQEWGPSKIIFKLDAGELGLDKLQYLYVVDKNGEANANGFKLCAGCPSAS